MDVLKTCLRPAVRAVREASVRARIPLRKGQGASVAFLPAYGREGAALLRIFNPAEALGRAGWRTLVLPPALTLAQRRRILSAARPDILVMQGARHALNRPALYPGRPIVYDMDDADFHLPHLAQPVERAMPDVACVVAGSRYVAEWCSARGAETEVVWTGSPVSGAPAPAQSGRPPVVAWAQSSPESYAGEAAWVIEVMRRVSARHPAVRLRLYDRRESGSDAFLARFREAGIAVEWYPSARYRDYLASFGDVRVGLAPIAAGNPFSRGKSFGKILAYLDRRVPVAASDTAEYAAFFDRASGVVSDDPGVWVEEILRLLSDAGARQAMADAAHVRFRTRLSVEESARRLGGVLERYLP